MHKIINTAVFIFFSSFVFAQKNSIIKGVAIDSISQKGLAYATLSLVNAKDSTLINFTRADSSGNFQFKKLSRGKYLLSASYVGFMPVWKPVSINEDGEINIGKIWMTDIAHTNSVVVEAKRPPVMMNNDTLEFNTENFKTAPNSVVEDLLKKLPGITVDADGSIKVNGQKVNKVYVNGKEFFTGDPKMATKNLDADAVDKVQVFDKKSDQAELTGIDDGNSQKSINLKLKKDRNNALFGKASAGSNFNDRYDAQLNMNKFNGDQQISFIGMGNNTNRQGFSLNDVLNFSGDLAKAMKNGGGAIKITASSNSSDNDGLPVTGLGQNQQGVATTYAGGINFNDTWNKKTDFNGNAVASDIHLNTNQNINRSYILPGNNYTYNAANNSTKDIQQERINMTIDQKIDTFNSFKLVPSITWHQQNNATNSLYSSVNTNNVKLNDGYNNTFSKQQALNFTNNFLYRMRTRKKGRTLSFNASMGYNSSNQNGSLNSKNTFYSGTLQTDSVLNQTNSIDATTFNAGANITYTEPVNKKTLLEISPFINSNVGESHKKTFDYNAATGNHDIINSTLTNNYKSNYTYGGGSINVRTNIKHANYTAGISFQNATLQSVNQTIHQTIKQSFNDFLPNASFQYLPSKYSSYRIDYSTSTSQPSTTQLQPVQNISDPLNIVVGNPDLKRSYNHNITANFFKTDPITFSNLFLYAGVGITNNAIVNWDSTFNNGSRKTTYVNANGFSYIFTNINYGFPVKKLKSRFELSLGYNYSNNISFINGLENKIYNNSFSPSLRWSTSIDKLIDIQAGTSFNFTQTNYSLQSQLNTNYTTQRYSAEVTNYLPWKLILNNSFNYTVNAGRADGYNTQIPLWNISIARSLFKNNRAEIKLSAFDLLNKNIGTNINSNQNYIENVQYNTLQRYFLLTFTYNLKKSSLANKGGIVIKTISN